MRRSAPSADRSSSASRARAGGRRAGSAAAQVPGRRPGASGKAATLWQRAGAHSGSRHGLRQSAVWCLAAARHKHNIELVCNSASQHQATEIESTMLDTTLFSMRLGSFSVCCLAILLYMGSSNIARSTTFGCAMVALIFQMLVCACLGTATPFPNRLGLSLPLVLIDFMAAFFAMGTGWAVCGINIFRMVKHACDEPTCTLSLVYGILVWLAGATGGIAASCHMACTAKLRLQPQH